jgi:hypothetical protein
VAVPLQDQLATDAEFSPDLVKVHMKCQYSTSFGQQLKVVGGAPELGEWDLSRVSTMLYNICLKLLDDGREAYVHVWM